MTGVADFPWCPFRILGPLELGREGHPESLPPGITQSILRAFLLHPNRRLSTGDLFVAGWGHVEVERVQLEKRIGQLRELLERLGGGTLVTHRGIGYELRVATHELDSLWFVHLVVAAEKTEDRDVEAGHLWRALRLWRSERVLAEQDGKHTTAEDLQRRLRRAAVRLFELEIGWGNYAGISHELARMVRAYPTDARLLEEYLIVLFRTGYPDEAIAAFARYEAALEEQELGQPDRDLRRLATAISAKQTAVVDVAEEALTGHPVGAGARPDPAATAAALVSRASGTAAIGTPPVGTGVDGAPTGGPAAGGASTGGSATGVSAAGVSAAGGAATAGTPTIGASDGGSGRTTDATDTPDTPGADATTGAVRTLDRPLVPRQLPPAPVDFVGRDDLVAEFTWLLTRTPRQAPPVLIVTGVGGIGKTWLMRRVAHATAEGYPDGQLHVELGGGSESMMDTAEVLAGFLRAFGVSPVPATAAERLATFRTLTADRRVLVLLDDAGDEDQIRDLIPAGPGCGVVVTTRGRLIDIDGAHPAARLDGLTPAVATDLLRSLTAGRGLVLRADDPGVERVVELCGGLPLALRIAAMMLVREGISPSELADRLAAQGPEALTFGPHSVTATIRASLARLGPAARDLFLGLALTELPEFGWWSAAAVLDGTGADPASTLAQLVDRCLLEPVGAGRRFRFHDLTRAYARQLAQRAVDDSDDRRTLIEHTYRALLTLARRAVAQSPGDDYRPTFSTIPDWALPAPVVTEQDATLPAWFADERTNIRAAVTHAGHLGLAPLAMDLALTVQEPFAVEGFFDDWHATSTAALTACVAAGDERGEGLLRLSLGQPSLVASGRATGLSGVADLERAVALLDRAGTARDVALARRTLANALRRRGQLTRPLELFQTALTGFTAAKDVLGQWQTERFIGQTHLDLGDPARALHHFDQARTRAEGRIQWRYPVAQLAYWTGQAHLAQAAGRGAQAHPDPTHPDAAHPDPTHPDPAYPDAAHPDPAHAAPADHDATAAAHLDAAATAFATVLTAFPGPGGIGHAYAHHGLGQLALRHGDLAAATDHLTRAATIAHDAADTTVEGRVHLTRADHHRATDDHPARIAELHQAIACFQAGDGAYYELVALTELAHAQADAHALDAARDTWRQVQQRYTSLHLPPADQIHRPPPGLDG